MLRHTTRSVRFFGTAVATWLIAVQVGICAPDWVEQAAALVDTLQVARDAPAVALHLSNDVQMSDDGTARQSVRRAVKVLISSGVEGTYLTVSINDHRKVKNLKGWRIDSNGKEHKLKDEYVAEVAVAEAAGYYNDYKTLAAAFPNTRTGDLIAWEYDIEEKDYWDGFYQAFTFQRSLPVARARFSVTVPDGWKLHISSQNTEPITYSSEGNRHEWISGYLPYRAPEPHMPSWRYVSRMVQVSCYNENDLRATHFSDWNRVAKWALELHRIQNPPADSIVALANSLCAGMTEPLEKLRAIAEYSRDEIRYVAVELGEGRFRPRDALSICVNRFGDCKDKVALMRALLDAVGTESYSVLAMTSGWVDENFPSPFQFNHVIVAIPLAKLPGFDSTSKACADGFLYFDPTSTSTPLGSLPTRIQGSQVLKASSVDTGLTRLPDLEPEDRLSRYSATTELGPGFHLTAHVTMTDYAHRAGEVRLSRMHIPRKDQLEDLQRLFSQSMQNVMVTDLTTGDDGDSVWASFILDGDYSVTEAGNMCLVKADFFHADRPDDFIKDERVLPIWLGSTRKQITQVEWKIPEGWTLDQNVDNIDDSCSDAHVTSFLEMADGIARYCSTLELQGYMMPTEEYGQVRAYFRKYRAAGKTRVILIKQ